MQNIEVRARKWGDSIAVIIPSQIVSQKSIKIGDKLFISITKGSDIKEVFGILNKENKEN
jgi:antitoxin component of MazEF toxin-antitoxin module